ncbi:hypothetical protein K493DRAFT_298868 [Basidiobolus meristosporus CBS 931.73]|uniref:Uncharacterized protein n=1 Tax=Basidiobolus meristosporus CBS 931.73 TaxID=1314790 RepID=A0A1Y1YR52_9FUNG|nr:hypothetical protein K493DRAFT_298868 [Basidiobolus meristosporus CBS 931.73]|eukprot:ORY00510.1 hypothetical protein K493DRAFT_298868 [Basidiobolus meristosporus CBS 931.73]
MRPSTHKASITKIKQYKDKIIKVKAETKQEISGLRKKCDQLAKENQKLSGNLNTEMSSKVKLYKTLEDERNKSSTLENELKRIQGILSKTQEVLSPLVHENNSNLDSLMAELKNASFFIDTVSSYVFAISSLEINIAQYTERTGTPNVSLVYQDYHSSDDS